jgi:hypothetical protein
VGSAGDAAARKYRNSVIKPHADTVFCLAETHKVIGDTAKARTWPE